MLASRHAPTGSRVSTPDNTLDMADQKPMILETRSGPELRVSQGANNPFTLTPLRLLCRSEGLSLSGFAGTLWHSGFGLALSQQCPELFERLFADQARMARLYALRPITTRIRPGELFEFGIALFGDAAREARACTDAFARLGALGLGEPRGHYRLLAACPDLPGSELSFDARTGHRKTPEPSTLSNPPDAEHAGTQWVDVTLQTPLLIKANNRQLSGPVPFDTLVKRIHGRLAQLCEASGQTNPFDRDEITRQIALAADVRLVDARIHTKAVKRTSARSAQTMQFPGLLGTLTYHGALAPFVPLLQAAERIQLGGKTAFGFGVLQCQFHSHEH